MLAPNMPAPIMRMELGDGGPVGVDMVLEIQGQILSLNLNLLVAGESGLPRSMYGAHVGCSYVNWCR